MEDEEEAARGVELWMDCALAANAEERDGIIIVAFAARGRSSLRAMIPFTLSERGWAADADGDGWGGWVDFSKEVNRSG